ncbi:DUF1289 domain-containing protein [Neisseria leonii]|uniref:DUF1289 domain-containing protein n=1 Tax=Neisseria leonii TaxID=2995413 RepID=UPI00237AB909|nr:DUF1289 domain-containing protein [Neisseria sp. 3986]MDD9325232.1 DUF1289 domain-containing protein [Neisseria sp. 3986]
MEQADFFDIPSPCTGVCQVNNKGYCKGCLRSREERLYWLHLTDGQKHQIMRLLAQRRKKLQQAALDRLEDFGPAPEQDHFDFSGSGQAV